MTQSAVRFLKRSKIFVIENAVAQTWNVGIFVSINRLVLIVPACIITHMYMYEIMNMCDEFSNYNGNWTAFLHPDLMTVYV